MRKKTLMMMLAPLALALCVTPATAGDGEEEEIPFDVATVYFELNNTDGDLGIHALIDGEPWKKLVIETPDERENMQIRLRNRFRRQGLTELFFESAEPDFDEFPAAEFFDRFPEGEYEVEGVTIEGEELESIAIVTHLMPAPPELEVNDIALPEDCDEDPVPSITPPLTVSWDPITMSHPDLGRTNEPITIERYEVVLENEDEDLKLFIIVTPDITEVALPEIVADEGGEWKIEVLAREDSGNQTATETCFEVD